MAYTNSLINMIHAQTPTGVFKVGDGATILGWTDRHAATITQIDYDRKANPKRVYVQEDIATRTDSNGMSESQEYTYAPNPNATHIAFTKRKNGRWVREGEPMKSGQALSIGERDEYYDYSF